MSVALTSLCHTRLDQRQQEAGLVAFGEAMGLARASGERHSVLRALEGVARGPAGDEPDAAVRLVAATDAQRLAVGAQPYPSERRDLDRWLAEARDALGS